MKAKIYPSKNLEHITIPASKSMSHRALICAALSKGKSVIKNIAFSDDVKVTIEGIKKLGASVVCGSDFVEVIGIQDFSNVESCIVNCKESGSTLRFFIPIFSLIDKEVVFQGENRLMKRPQEIYKEIFLNQNLKYVQNEDQIIIKGKLKAQTYKIKGDVSSQFISGLLFMLPLLSSDSKIEITGVFESKSYVDLTIDMLKKFNVEIIEFENGYLIKGNQAYQAFDYTVEADFSQLGFFAVLGAINHKIVCHGLNFESKQGDKKIVELLKDCKIKHEISKDTLAVYPTEFESGRIDLSDCPDLGPILTVLGTHAKDNFVIYNAKRLRFKESDRIDAIESELTKLGVTLKTTEDTIVVLDRKNIESEKEVIGHKDHRIVMSLAVYATVLNYPVVIDQAESIEKSYPTFFDDLKQLGIKVKLYES